MSGAGVGAATISENVGLFSVICFLLVVVGCFFSENSGLFSVIFLLVVVGCFCSWLFIFCFVWCPKQLVEQPTRFAFHCLCCVSGVVCCGSCDEQY